MWTIILTSKTTGNSIILLNIFRYSVPYRYSANHNEIVTKTNCQSECK